MMASGSLSYCFPHLRTMRSAALSELTIGTSATSGKSLVYSGSFIGRPAPDTIMSTPAWHALLTCLSKSVSAAMQFTATTPSGAASLADVTASATAVSFISK
jgi:hypothetical protein